MLPRLLRKASSRPPPPRAFVQQSQPFLGGGSGPTPKKIAQIVRGLPSRAAVVGKQPSLTGTRRQNGESILTVPDSCTNK